MKAGEVINGFELVKVHSRRWDVNRDGEPVYRARKKEDAVAWIEHQEALAETEVVETEAAEEEETATAEETEATEDAPAETVPEDAPYEPMKGTKISLAMLRHIRYHVRPHFEQKIPGKMKTYRELADRLNLGLETVAKISRRDIYPEIGNDFTEADSTYEPQE